MTSIRKMIVSVLTLALVLCLYGISKAAVDSDQVQVSVDVLANIQINSPADVDIGDITGAQTVQGSVTWNIITNNSGGYKMEWQADAATMASGGDTIAAYTPAVGDTPETWSVAAADSEWGGRLSDTSTDDNTADWGVDGVSEKWLNVNNAAVREIVQRTSETSTSDEVVEFQAEVGASKFQPTGSYTVNVTATATTL